MKTKKLFEIGTQPTNKKGNQFKKLKGDTVLSIGDAKRIIATMEALAKENKEQEHNDKLCFIYNTEERTLRICGEEKLYLLLREVEE